MKYIALLSGGKDSCYNLLHCAKNGHELVAAASLGPGHGEEELDSYLYQTVGQDAIEFVAHALEVPLYRHVISGAAVEQGTEYGGRNAKDGGGIEGDETEDLYALLSIVKSHHPDIQGVSVGAILSNYQRVRVEHVCRRLSLTPLCYLWQRDQAELLSEMIEAGMESILIKVAGIGLTTKHLGKTLADMQATLIKLNDLYGSHICGEGGEYETLTLDCPLFKHRIILIEVETVIHSDNDFATVAFLRIKNAILERKPAAPDFNIIIPQILDDDFTRVCDVALQSHVPVEPSIRQPANETSCSAANDMSDISSRRIGSWVAITNVQKALQGNAEIEEEVVECFHLLEDELAKYSLRLSHCANINIFLSSMDLFARVNSVYGTFFGTSPPARACVAVDLPVPIRVRLDCLVYSESSPADRQALHVQSLSYWAPANIGPYSQAITANERICISGQIGLLPSSLALPSPRSLPMETALSFQHVDRVINALKANSSDQWKGRSQLNLYWLASSVHLPQVKKACEVHEKEDTPTLFLGVKALPKDALIEKQVLLHTGRYLVSDEYDEQTLQRLSSVTDRGDFSRGDCCLHWEASWFMESGAACITICVRGIGAELDFSRRIKAVPALSTLLLRALSVRLFYKPQYLSSFNTLNEDLFSRGGSSPVTPIPCRFISTRATDGWDYAVCILCT